MQESYEKRIEGMKRFLKWLKDPSIKPEEDLLLLSKQHGISLYMLQFQTENVELLENMRPYVLSTKLYHKRLWNLTQETIETYKQEGIDVLFWKGFVFDKLLYGGKFIRHQSDIDLLVKPTDLYKSARIAKAFGFQFTVPPRSQFHVNYSHQLFDHFPSLKKDGVLLEIHHSINGVDTQQCWENINEIEGLPVPSLEIMWKAANIHYLKHVKSQDVKLKWLLDIFLALQKFPESASFFDKAVKHQANLVFKQDTELTQEDLASLYPIVFPPAKKPKASLRAMWSSSKLPLPLKMRWMFHELFPSKQYLAYRYNAENQLLGWWRRLMK